MTTLRRFSLAVALLASALIASSRAIALSTNAPDTGDADGYGVGVQVSDNGGGATWTYTITKSTATTKDLGHFILNFDTCGGQSPTIASIVSATVNGVSWLDQIEATEGVTGCGVPSANFVKFDNLPEADTYVIQFTLDDAYPLMDSTAWLKSGAVCLRKALPGPGCKGYLRTSTMEADSSLAGKTYSDINTYMRRFGFDYTEHPNCTGGYGGHIDGIHGDVEAADAFLNRPVFRFDIHIDPVIDGDRCSSSTVDRQRNEMKSITNNSTWAKVQGNWDEWQILEWKFKLPIGLQPTANFFHIHQLKAQDGPNNGAPTITITPRASSSGLNKRIQIIHSVDGRNTDKGTIVDNVPRPTSRANGCRFARKCITRTRAIMR